MEVAALRINENCSAGATYRIPIVVLGAVAVAGCLGEPGIDPELQAQRDQLSRQTVETAGFDRGDAIADRSAELADSDAGMDADPMATPEEPDPEPAEPPPVPGGADDSVRCGNGVLDNDEICEISLPEGEPGACPSKCSDDPCKPEKMEARGCWSVCLPLAPAPDANCG